MAVTVDGNKLSAKDLSGLMLDRPQTKLFMKTPKGEVINWSYLDDKQVAEKISELGFGVEQ